MDCLAFLWIWSTPTPCHHHRCHLSFAILLLHCYTRTPSFLFPCFLLKYDVIIHSIAKPANLHRMTILPSPPSEHHQLIYGVLFLPQFLPLFSGSLYSSYSSSFVLFTLSFSFLKEIWRKYFSNNFLWIIYVMKCLLKFLRRYFRDREQKRIFEGMKDVIAGWLKQSMQCTYNVKLGRVRLTIFAVETQ